MVRKLRSGGDKAGVLCDTLALQRDDATALAASDDLITKLRGDLSESRKVLVDAAFDALDYEGEGSVALTDVVQAYDAASHPEVLAGARTREAAKREFLETFEVDGDRASLQNFREYYANVSAAVDDDALFATLVRNAWSLNVEKQSPRGVHALVTHRDGRQSVEVLSEDGEDAHRRACGFGDGLVLFWTTRWYSGDVGGGVYNCNRALRCRLVQAELLPRLVAS